MATHTGPLSPAVDRVTEVWTSRCPPCSPTGLSPSSREQSLPHLSFRGLCPSGSAATGVQKGPAGLLPGQATAQSPGAFLLALLPLRNLQSCSMTPATDVRAPHASTHEAPAAKAWLLTTSQGALEAEDVSPRRSLERNLICTK